MHSLLEEEEVAALARSNLPLEAVEDGAGTFRMRSPELPGFPMAELTSTQAFNSLT